VNFNIFKIETTCRHVLFILIVSSHTISKYYAKDTHYFFLGFFFFFFFSRKTSKHTKWWFMALQQWWIHGSKKLLVNDGLRFYNEITLCLIIACNKPMLIDRARERNILSHYHHPCQGLTMWGAPQDNPLKKESLNGGRSCAVVPKLPVWLLK
jgi:hypothetical protein